jgi:hypothetical protein
VQSIPVSAPYSLEMGLLNHRWRLALLFALAALCGWIALDLALPVRGALREFDAHAVARMETSMWRSYYGHRPVRLFAELAGLLRRQYRLPFWRSYLGAYYGARAAVVFQRGRTRADCERALPPLVRFYRLIRRSSDVPFDPGQVARLELEWWIIHRRRFEHRPQDLVRALANLQAAIYLAPAARFATHADARAEAMLLRDERAAAGAVTEADWARIAALLDTSWTSLHAAVSQ